jgi:hypothetical protein
VLVQPLLPKIIDKYGEQMVDLLMEALIKFLKTKLAS